MLDFIWKKAKNCHINEDFAPLPNKQNEIVLVFLDEDVLNSLSGVLLV